MILFGAGCVMFGIVCNFCCSKKRLLVPTADVLMVLVQTIFDAKVIDEIGQC